MIRYMKSHVPPSLSHHNCWSLFSCRLLLFSNFSTLLFLCEICTVRGRRSLNVLQPFLFNLHEFTAFIDYRLLTICLQYCIALIDTTQAMILLCTFVLISYFLFYMSNISYYVLCKLSFAVINLYILPFISHIIFYSSIQFADPST